MFNSKQFNLLCKMHSQIQNVYRYKKKAELEKGVRSKQGHQQCGAGAVGFRFVLTYVVIMYSFLTLDEAQHLIPVSIIGKMSSVCLKMITKSNEMVACACA